MVIKDVTDSAKDWEDFWSDLEAHETWTQDDFETIWNEMDSIEPLTPITQSQRKP
tara:strand:- start:363 stop:527 length:165 start_codon:yes stop_codon:yes gene_type:complete